MYSVQFLAIANAYIFIQCRYKAKFTALTQKQNVGAKPNL